MDFVKYIRSQFQSFRIDKQMHLQPRAGADDRLPYQPRLQYNGASSTGINYQSLAENAFRLLKLNGYTSEGVLDCCLVEISLEDAHDYTAISYTWNEASSLSYNRFDLLPRPVIINGETIQLRNKVAYALVLALLHGKQWIWIDSICINQSDTLEKGRQVAQMGKIFAGAADVLCFLNNPTVDTDDLLDRINNKGELPAGSLSMGDVYALLAIMSNSYWTRAWTLQEMILAKQAVICCGKKLVRLPQLITLTIQLSDEYKSKPPPMESREYKLERILLERVTEPSMMTFFTEVFHPGNPLLSSWNKSNSEAGADCLDILLRLQISRECSDHRDILYSKLALSPSFTTLIPHPDYSITVDEVYKQFAANHILLSRSLKIVTSATSTAKQLPSWVPDWASKQECWRAADGDAAAEAITHLLERISWTDQHLPRISKCRNELTVQGVVLARVDGLTARDHFQLPFRSLHPDSLNFLSDEAPRLGDLVCALRGCHMLVYLRQIDDHHVLVARHRMAQERLMSKKNLRIFALARRVDEALQNPTSLTEIVFKIR